MARESRIVLLLLVVAGVGALVWYLVTQLGPKSIRGRYLRLVDRGIKSNCRGPRSTPQSRTRASRLGIFVPFYLAMKDKSKKAYAVKAGGWAKTRFREAVAPEPADVSGDVYHRDWWDWRRVIKDNDLFTHPDVQGDTLELDYGEDKDVGFISIRIRDALADGDNLAVQVLNSAWDVVFEHQLGPGTIFELNVEEIAKNQAKAA